MKRNSKESKISETPKVDKAIAAFEKMLKPAGIGAK